MSRYFRKNIAAMSGYTPGEQPQQERIIKLNTNENPFPPGDKVKKALAEFDLDRLRKYPHPASLPVTSAAAKVYNIQVDNIIAGNGSDEILTILIRSFCDQGDTIGWLDPSYSLYCVLADIQGCEHRPIKLEKDFSLPKNWEAQAAGCSLFFVTRPNAPTGINQDKERLEKFITTFDGVVVIDEAYADFADDNCLDLISRFDNVVVTRTLSKSYSLAGIRSGLAFSNPDIIAGMHKVRDSYNVNFLTQVATEAALLDQDYLQHCIAQIKAERSRVQNELQRLGFDVLPSQSNFLFARVPDKSADQAQKINQQLKDQGVFVRYFNVPGIDDYLRISIGSREEMDEFFTILKGVL